MSESDLTHAQRELAKQMQCMFYMQTMHPEHGPIYLYVVVRGDRAPAFRAALEQQDEIEVEQFGTIVASGHGQPTVEEMMKIEAQFGITHANIVQVPPLGAPIPPEDEGA